MQYQLLEDIISKKKTMYGKKGDVVTLVADYDNVLIVEAKNKERFSILKDKVKPMPAHDKK